MAIVRRTSKAAHDLVDVGEFVAAHDLRAADRLLHRDRRNVPASVRTA